MLHLVIYYSFICNPLFHHVTDPEQVFLAQFFLKQLSMPVRIAAHCDTTYRTSTKRECQVGLQICCLCFYTLCTFTWCLPPQPPPNPMIMNYTLLLWTREQIPWVIVSATCISHDCFLKQVCEIYLCVRRTVNLR